MSSGMVQAVVALCNRGGVTAEDLGVHHLHALVNVKMPMHPADDCPLCHHNIPINTNVGHGRAFLASKAVQTG
jgi:orotate phosphoribosyltransferase